MKVQGEVPALAITAFFGTAWGNAMWMARLATRSTLKRSAMATVHARSQSPQPVQAAGSTKVAFLRTRATKLPSALRSIPSTSADVITVMLG